MADVSLSSVLDRFTATVQKGGLVAVPAETQRKLGLTRRRDNHLLRFSFRRAGAGRWNHSYARLTYDNEFALPVHAPGVAPGKVVDVIIRQVLITTPAPLQPETTGAALLVALADDAGRDDREVSAHLHDEYLNEETERGADPDDGT